MDTESEIISFYETELNYYKIDILPQLNESILSDRLPYNLAIDGLLNLYLFSLYLLDNSKIYFTEPAKFSLNLFFTKTASDIISLHQCLSIGQRISSAYIIRSIFETYVDLKLIADSDSDFRMKLYEDFQIITKWNHYCNYQKYLLILEKDNGKKLFEETKNNCNALFSEQEISELKISYESISNNYHPKIPHHWAWLVFKDKLKGNNPRLNFICSQIGLYPDYLQIYSTTSIAIHNDPLTINLLVKNGHATPSPNFSKYIANDAGLVLNYTIEIFLTIFNLIKSPKYYEIELYLNYFYHKYIE